MSATQDSSNQAVLDLQEKIANLEADTRLKDVQTRFEPLGIVVSGFAATEVLLAAGGAVGALLTRVSHHSSQPATGGAKPDARLADPAMHHANLLGLSVTPCNIAVLRIESVDIAPLLAAYRKNQHG